MYWTVLDLIKTFANVTSVDAGEFLWFNASFGPVSVSQK